jgi:enoyl-CoA hydratase/carnithine racemase
MVVLYEKEDKIVTITLNRPEAFNAFDPETATAFSEALIKFRDDHDAWVAIITGAGSRAFCAGADLKKLIPVLVDGSFPMPPWITRGLEIWKPFIAAINGMALGGGLEVALACDLRIAAENATFGTPEVRWGLIPGWGGTQRVSRFLPRAKAAEILLVGDPIDANEAYRIGLVNKVVPLSELMPTAKQLASRICQNGPLGVRAAKEAMIRGSGMSLEDGLRLEELLFGGILATEDVKEGLAAFAAKPKRKPEYKGR